MIYVNRAQGPFYVGADGTHRIEIDDIGLVMLGRLILVPEGCSDSIRHSPR